MERLSATEYRWATGLAAEAAERTGRDVAAVRGLLTEVAARLRAQFGQATVQFRQDSVKFVRAAGLVRAGDGLEIDVAPKFLGQDWPGWREDFFLVAALSRYGTVLTRDDIAAGVSAPNDLAELMARAFVREYWRHHLRPMRTYRHHAWHAFEVDGDLDPEGVALPHMDGFPQTASVFTKDNPYSGRIHAAAGVLLREVGTSPVRGQLERVHVATRPLTRHAAGARRPVAPSRVPARHSRWQLLYDLSGDILRGLGAGYVPGGLSAPGFVLQTEKAWEDLVGHLLRRGLPGASVRWHERHRLGVRAGEEALVQPDYTVDAPGLRALLVDAKYRSRAAKKITLERGDLYEALAFARAAKAERVLLVYPRPARLPVADVGSCEVADRYDVGGCAVVALSVECRGISATGGFLRMSQGVGEAIRKHGG